MSAWISVVVLQLRDYEVRVLRAMLCFAFTVSDVSWESGKVKKGEVSTALRCVFRLELKLWACALTFQFWLWPVESGESPLQRQRRVLARERGRKREKMRRYGPMVSRITLLARGRVDKTSKTRRDETRWVSGVKLRLGIESWRRAGTVYTLHTDIIYTSR